jgi:hypothetical protein
LDLIEYSCFSMTSVVYLAGIVQLFGLLVGYTAMATNISADWFASFAFRTGFCTSLVHH